MNTDSAYLTKSQYMQSYWFSNKSNINIIYNISVITITITMTIILGNFGKYAISDCPFITCYLPKFDFGKYVRCLLVTCQNLILASMFVGCVCYLYVRLTVCYLPKFRRNLQVCSFDGLSVCLFVCLFVCLSVTRYRSQFLTNQHQTWSTYGIWSNTSAYTFYRAKVK